MRPRDVGCVFTYVKALFTVSDRLCRGYHARHQRSGSHCKKCPAAPDPANWERDRRGIDHNVVPIGGGRTCSALAFAVRRAGIGKVSVIDAAPDEARAGVWLTAARTNLLRTPKNLPGPEQAIPELGFQAWYEARHGADADAAIDHIPRLSWVDHLGWYRHFLSIKIRYNTRLGRIEPADEFFRLYLSIADEPRAETPRKIVLATDFTGNGGAHVPPELATLPHDPRSHTQDSFDFSKRRSKTSAVVGAAATFDAAGVVLESGGRPSIFSYGATPSHRSRSRACAAMPVHMTIIATCQIPFDGTRSSVFAATGQRRPSMPSNARSLSLISTCISVRREKKPILRQGGLLPMQRMVRTGSIT